MVNFKHMHAKLLQRRAADLSAEARRNVELMAMLDHNDTPHSYDWAKNIAVYSQRAAAECYARARELAEG